MSAELKRAIDRLEACRKKLIVGGKAGAGNESAYAEAYAALCRIDPIRYRPVRGKRR